MSAYGYGPPPPPPPSQPPAGYGQYQSSSYQHTSQHPRGGSRGGGHHAGSRSSSGEYQHPAGYGYAPQTAQGYGQPSHYASGPPQHGGYAPPQQQWPHDPAPHSHAHQHQPPPPQSYHSSYAPQIYAQQPQPTGQVPAHQASHPPALYGQQPSYGHPPAASQQQSYAHQYSHPAPSPSSLPPQPWGPPSHRYNDSGRGRGRGGGSHHGHHQSHHDRGGKTQMMGPPIRIGFENGSSTSGQAPAAPVSSSYLQQPPPPQPYRHAQGSPVATPPPRPSGYAPGPYQGYPPPGPAPSASPPHYDPFYSHSSRQYSGRGGYQSNSYRGGRGNYSGDKMRHKKSYGGSNKAPHPQSHQKPDAASAGKKKKRKTNTLGLTPGEESDEEDADEEAKLVEMIGPDAPNPTDITAWIEQRRRNFPTQDRIAAKLAGTAKDGGDKAGKTGGNGASGTAAKNSASGLTALERQQQKAEKLRKQLEKVESSIKRKREQQDEGDEMRDADGGDSSDASSDSKSDDDDDAAPETLPIRSNEPKLPSATKRADHTKHCKYYSTGGTCGKKGKCRFVHDPAVREEALRERERNGGRMTLQQRLTLNDKDQEDLTIVKTLQYLKEKGIMKDCVGPATSSSAKLIPAGDGDSTAAASQDADASEHTIARETSPMLVEPLAAEEAQDGAQQEQLEDGQDHQQDENEQPQLPSSSSASTAQYLGWNLSGFGNTGVKSGDL